MPCGATYSSAGDFLHLWCTKSTPWRYFCLELVHPEPKRMGGESRPRHTGNVSSLGRPLWTPQESPYFSRPSEETCLF